MFSRTPKPAALVASKKARDPLLALEVPSGSPEGHSHGIEPNLPRFALAVRESFNVRSTVKLLGTQ